jgi:transposase
LGNENIRIAELELLLEAALYEIERLKAENAALKETVARLERSSGNSSKPPSSDIVKPPKTLKSKGKRKIGAQRGHEQHQRKPFGENEVDRIIDLTLEACPKCSGALSAACEAPKKHQQVELVEKPFFVTEYRQHRYWCSGCQCYHEARLPLEVKRAGLFGQNLITLTAYMKGRCHMSYKSIQSFYADALGVKVSAGFLVNQIRKASDALKEPYDYLVGQLAKAGHLHVDETGNKENGERRWTWCLRGADFTVFHINPLRSSAVLEKLLGKEYGGIISSDFHSLYKKYKQTSKARLQLCWAHLIREVKFIAEQQNEETSAWGQSLLEQIRKMFLAYHRRKDMSAHNWRRKMRSCKKSILEVALCQVPQRKIAESLSARFQKWHEEYFRFIDEGLPPTNNLCEQSIRHVVIDRKITQGTRSDWGNRMSERTWTVIATCTQRGDNIMSFIRSCVGAFLKGISPPLFPFK